MRAAGGALTDVSMVNAATSATVTGAFDAGKAAWTTNEPLGYGSTYRVTATAVSSDGRKVRQESTIGTLEPQKRAEPNLIPAPDAVAGTGIGVGQPIVFQFTAPVQDKAAVERQLSVVSQPAQEGSWYWIDDQHAHYRPQQYWQPGTTLTVSAKVYGVNFGNGVYGAEDRTETYHVHDSWIAKADGNAVQMTIYHNGSPVKTMPISMGKDSTPTHLGPHVISEKHAVFTMDSCTYGVCPGNPEYYRSDERWSLRISNDGEFVHENPASVSAQGNTNVSHGCINLNADNAKWFFDHFGLGDVVEVTNSGGPQLPVWDLYGDWALSWQDWQAGSALR
ncbi:Ig-like domain-containing protein [Saccharomonospora sp. NPDC046836]|uniref:L,D-transpeptidase n=1 Tax=Saccharomonospora sp. NPDC046836 TaxID=3156921 RepID=UPI0034025267